MKYPPAASMKYAADVAYDLSALHADKQQFSARASGRARKHTRAMLENLLDLPGVNR